jgi:NOL1/NOP2/fmu family ribosome biogenesis protein
MRPAPAKGSFAKIQLPAPSGHQHTWPTVPSASGAFSRKRSLWSQKGGYSFYSTCTYNRAENDDNSAFLAAHDELSYQAIPQFSNYALAPRTFGYQAYPHQLAGEGFYLAAFRKQHAAFMRQKPREFSRIQRVPRRESERLHDWIAPDLLEQAAIYVTPSGRWRAIPKHLLAAAQVLAQHLKRLEVGIALGQPKGRDWLPDESLAFSLHLHPNLSRVEVAKAVALDILRKQTPPSSELMARGWHLVTHKKLGLAWVKGLGNRYNNYYPQAWRIRMRQDW